MNLSRDVSIAAIAVAVAAAVPGTPTAWADEPLLRLRAAAVDPGASTPTGTRPASAGFLDIVIERWTTDAEHERLAAVLAEQGEDRALSALQKMPRAGYIRTPRSLGWEVHYAREVPGPDGSRRILVATDRPMSFWELWNRPQSADYQYVFAEVRLGPDGRGQGTMVPAARIHYDPSTRMIEVEDYSSQPVRLTDVRVEK